MSSELVDAILLLVAFIVLDFAALHWRADSRRFNARSYTPG
jgi:hypothetical protein